MRFNAPTIASQYWLERAVGVFIATVMLALPIATPAQTSLIAQAVLMRQDFSDCANITVSGFDPKRIGGAIALTQVPNDGTSAVVTHRTSNPDSTNEVFDKCHSQLGTIDTYGAGVGSGIFSFHAEPVAKLTFNSYPWGAAFGNEFPSVAAAPQVQTGAYRVIYSFRGKPDGSAPKSGLIPVGDALYGSTMNGGSAGTGTVYTIAPTGLERVTGSFNNAANGGFFPVSGLTALAFLYGTTERGGPYSSGTVYALTPGLSLLYAFQGGMDGSYPEGALLAKNGALIGTTSNGGQGCGGIGCGTVFLLNLSGQELVTYRFTGGADGGQPYAGLIDVNDTLYGTARGGGSKSQGVVFAITIAGQERVLHSFTGGADGATPMSRLLAFGGKLYGTTTQGGSSGHGTVFSVSLDGSESVLHSFAGGDDGGYPRAGLVQLGGLLYGVTVEGGKFGKGVLFSVAPSGAEVVLHDFGGLGDGTAPAADLLVVGSTLYGTTPYGGDTGNGTVFTYTP